MLESLWTSLANAGYIVQVVVAFSVLVVVHEFGHFIVAKKTGCRVDEFAVGFGPALWQHKPKYSETLYALRVIPLGGYNRIWGYEDVSTESFQSAPESEKQRAFINRPLFSRFLVLVAGSTFNFVLAVLLVAGWGMTVGFPYTVIADVTPGMPAEAAGIQSGQIVRNFGFASSPGDISASIATQAERGYIDITTREASGRLETHRLVPKFNAEAGRPLIGITMEEALGNRVDDLAEDSIYYAAGIREGDHIVAVNGTPTESAIDIYTVLDESPEESNTAQFTIARAGAEQQVEVEGFRVWQPGALPYPEGVLPSNDFKLEAVIPESAADKAGLLAGDVISAVNGKPLTMRGGDWLALMVLDEFPELALDIKRPAGKGVPPQEMQLVLKAEDVDRVVHQAMGFNQLYLRVNPVQAFAEGIQMTAHYTRFIGESLISLFNREHAVSELTGPIGIFRVSFRAAQNGALDLMLLMVLLTINLGIFNLLPFPALDGGRIIFLALEAIFRRPVVNIQIENLIHVGGFLLLIVLMLYISAWDVQRFWA